MSVSICLEEHTSLIPSLGVQVDTSAEKEKVVYRVGKQEKKQAN